jgi:hypothetical protein
MKRRKTPQEKKALEYEKDHISYPNSRERARKRSANREYRHEVHLVLTRIKAWDGDFQVDELQTEQVARGRAEKRWIVVPLGEVVARRLRLRWERRAIKFFNHKYWAPRDRERFVAFLTSLTSAPSQYTHELVEMFDGTLEARSEKGLPNSTRQYDRFGRWRKQYLHGFFRDEPEWEERVRAWIASFDE